MSALDQVLSRIDAQLEPALERLFAFLKIKSISTDPAYAAECKAAAEWQAADLASIGFDATVRPTPGHPMVVAHDRSAKGPSALFYGHYDVQPVDPLELWDHDPFAPFIETRADGTKAIRARGASDDKGQIMVFVEACRAWKHVTGSLPIPMTVLIEGEEESGGVNLPPFLEANAAELRADIGLICDTNMWDARTPAIQTMLRGLCGEEIDDHRRRPGPAFGLLRLGRGQPQPCAGPDPGRPARCRRPHHHPPLLRRRARAARGPAPSSGPRSISIPRRSWAPSACRCRPARRADRCWR